MGINEEEGFVLAAGVGFAAFAEARQGKRAPEGAAEDVADELVAAAAIWIGALLVCHGVECAGVAVILKRRTVKLVGATLGHIIDYGALVAAVLRRVVSGDDLKFLDRVRVRNEEVWPADGQVVVVRAIKGKVVGAGAIAVYGKRHAIRVDVAKTGHYTRRQQSQRVEAAARCVGWQFFDLARFEASRDLRV